MDLYQGTGSVNVIRIGPSDMKYSVSTEYEIITIIAALNLAKIIWNTSEMLTESSGNKLPISESIATLKSIYGAYCGQTKVSLLFFVLIGNHMNLVCCWAQTDAMYLDSEEGLLS